MKEYEVKKESAVQAFLLAIVAAPLACLAAVWFAGVPESSQLLARGIGMFLFEWVMFFVLFVYFSDDGKETEPQS